MVRALLHNHVALLLSLNLPNKHLAPQLMPAHHGAQLLPLQQRLKAEQLIHGEVRAQTVGDHQLRKTPGERLLHQKIKFQQVLEISGVNRPDSQLKQQILSAVAAHQQEIGANPPELRLTVGVEEHLVVKEIGTSQRLCLVAVGTNLALMPIHNRPGVKATIGRKVLNRHHQRCLNLSKDQVRKLQH